MACMVELGELEAQYQQFANRKVRVYAISMDKQQPAQETQGKFPHLSIVSDADQNLAKAVQVVQKGGAPDGGDTNASTTFLVDGTGQVRWFYRPSSLTAPLSPDELLKAIDNAG
jgi:peroxiredoxin